MAEDALEGSSGMTMTNDLPAMRAVVHDRHGDPRQVLRLAESQPVSAPGRGQVLIRVTARPIHPGDLLGVARGDVSGGLELASSRIPGMEGAGVVVAVGSDVVDVRPDQRVAFFPAAGAGDCDAGTSARYRMARLLGRVQLSAFRRVGPVEREWNSPFHRF